MKKEVGDLGGSNSKDSYTFENTISGVILGTWEAKTLEEAAEMWAKQEGYISFAEMYQAITIRNGEIRCHSTRTGETRLLMTVDTTFS